MLGLKTSEAQKCTSCMYAYSLFHDAAKYERCALDIPQVKMAIPYGLA